MENKIIPATMDDLRDIRQVIQENGLQFTDQELMKRVKKFKHRLNMDPRPGWYKTHPDIKLTRVDPNGNKFSIPYLYLPIARMEWLAANIYLAQQSEITQVLQIANSVTIYGRVGLLNPVTGLWEWYGGVGAAPLQTNKGAGPLDWTQIKSNAVQIGAPAAWAYARKNAMQQAGKIFGRDTAREDQISYDALEKEASQPLNA